MDINEIKRRLSERALDVAAHLLPAGKKEGQEWRVGSIRGEPGKSLGVHLTGAKAGLWSDFSTGEAGDLLDLWCNSCGIETVEALHLARKWLGVEAVQTHRPLPKTYARPLKPICVVPQQRVLDYLTEDRNIPREVISRYNIGEAGTDIIFPFLLPDGTLAMAKRRKAEDGAAPIPTAGGCEPILFGWQAVPDCARDVVITEGEIDAMSWAAYGYAALSVPYGGGGGAKQQWIESEYERLQRFEKIYLALDMDEPGELAAREIADRLGKHRCLRVSMPFKDGNACLQEGVSQIAMNALIEQAKTYDPDGLASPSSFTQDLVDMFYPQAGQRLGYAMPYQSLGDQLLFRQAELTIWTGASGAGKSQILSDCVVDWVRQGSMVCLSSLEMKPQQTLKRMAKQVVGTDRPTTGAIHDAMQFLDTGLILYTLTGKAKMDALLEVFDYCRSKYGCDQFVIDSLMRLGIAGDDYNGQEGAIFRLVDWVMERGVHVHLVAHSRKGERGAVPETEDIKGAMEIGANAFNILTIWRNRKLEEGNESDKAPVVLNVAKQRNGDFEGKVGLWFNQACYQYRSARDNPKFPREYLDRKQERIA